MKKIINGRRYDTDTARELASDSYSNYTDFNYWEETLYRKNTGEYFLHGKGGANTQYAVAVDTNSWRGGERIMPLTIREAQEWAEKHLDGNEYEKIFGTVEEGKKVVTFSLDAETVEKIARGAAALGISKSDFIAKCVDANT